MVKFTIILLHAIIVILTLLPSPSTQLKQFTYEDPQAGLDLLDKDKSNDGTIILRFGNPTKQVNGKGTTNDYMKTWGFDQNFMLAFYNSSNVTTSAIMGIFITYEGKVLSTANLLHDALIDDGGIKKYSFVIPNSSSRDGFFVYCHGSTVLSWIHFSTPNKNGEIFARARSGIIQTNVNIVTTSAFYVLERGFALAYGGDDSPINLNNSNNPTVDMNIGDMKNVTSYGYNIEPLRFGGYLMIKSQDNLMSGYILDANGDLYSNWSLPQPLNYPMYKSTYVLLVNNSIVAVENQNNSTWSVICDDSPKFTDKASINPTLGSRVYESTKQLHLSFHCPVTLSSSNISIYQSISGTGHDLLRQRFQGVSPNQFCQIDPNDNKTVIINVFPSTFNEPNSHYYVVIENNFVKRSGSNEALLGIDKNLWTLVTENKQYVYSSPITGIIRLSPDGSSYYLSLSSVDQQKFNEQMATDLSYIIPVEDNRLTSINGFEKDISTGTLQILLYFNIKDTKDLSKKSASNITQDFNTLLKYKKYSALMAHNTTSLIDENYPMTIAPLFLRDYLGLIIIIIIALIVLIKLYFLASWKFKEANNFAMFKVIIIIVDLGLRISFVIYDARKVPELWLP
ncbi:43771_t:CDS:10, partial [Gigaspora margarita]